MHMHTSVTRACSGRLFARRRRRSPNATGRDTYTAASKHRVPYARARLRRSDATRQSSQFVDSRGIPSLSSVFDLLIPLDSTRFKDQARSTMRREHRCNGDDAQSTDLSLTPANVDRASLLSSLSLSVSPQPQLLIGSIVEQNRNYPRRSARRREEPTPPFPATGRARVSRDRSLIPRSKFKVNVKTARLAHTPRRQGRIDTRRVAVRIRGTCRRANSTQLV